MAANAIALPVALKRGAYEVNLRIADIVAYDVFHRTERGETDLGKGIRDPAHVVSRHQIGHVNRFAFLDELAEVAGDDALREMSCGGYLLHI